MTNREKFKSAEERRVAYKDYCEECGRKHKSITDEFGWLELKYKDLKPCPFCGSENIDVYKNEVADVWFVACNECGCRINSYMNREIAINSWNSRFVKIINHY